MPRRKKLVIVSAVLLAGMGAAFLFRKGGDSGPTGDATSQTTLSSESPLFPSIDAEAVPRLAGDVDPRERQIPSKQPSVRGKPARSTLTSPAPNGVVKSATDEVRPGKAVLSDSLKSTQSDDKDIATDGESPEDQTQLDPLPARSKPAASAQEPPPDSISRVRVHKIRDGDTLPALAERFLGDRTRDLDIFAANRDVLANPELLPIGTALRIPDRDARPVAIEDSPSDMVPLERGGTQNPVPLERGGTQNPVPHGR